ncbi:tripartite tricarboxylate transporter substrate-binding protein [Cupriavidus basilensis]
MIKDAHARPGTVSYASWGTGNTTHLIGELFARSAGIKVLHVLLQGFADQRHPGWPRRLHIHGVVPGRSVDPGGQARALAISSEQRVKEMPAVPTLRELGIKDVDIPAWSGTCLRRQACHCKRPPCYSARWRLLHNVLSTRPS